MMCMPRSTLCGSVQQTVVCSAVGDAVGQALVAVEEVRALCERACAFWDLLVHYGPMLAAQQAQAYKRVISDFKNALIVRWCTGDAWCWHSAISIDY